MDPLWILGVGMAVVIGGILLMRLHAFLALLLGALIVALLTPQTALEDFARDEAARGRISQVAADGFAQQSAGERIAVEFGKTCTQIAILIAMAAIIGKCLLDSGAADRIVRGALGVVGERQAPVAFVFSGFLLGIPVFFDTVFYLMIPLGKAMWMRTRRNYLLYVMTITAGATMAHSLVPPTPGPLLVASQLGVDIGLMILGGGAVGLVTVVFGYAFALIVNRLKTITVRESADLSMAELEQLAARDVSELPPLALSLTPVLLPVVLIGGQTAMASVLKAKGALAPAWLLAAEPWITGLGNKNIALLIAAAIALAMLAWRRRTSRAELAAAVQAALASGAVIILITAAGGAFGGALRQTGIAGRIQELAPTSQAAILPLAFFVSMLVRTAQGSATVAMITAVGILAPLAESTPLGFDPLYLALAIGCGSKPISWMNDSGFWVISKMSGMTEAETLTCITPMTALMGFVGLAATMVGATLWPFPAG